MVSLQAPAEFLDAASEYGISFEGDDLDRLERFLGLLLETNRQFNLTSITDPDQAWMRHIFDSLTLLPYLEHARAKRVIDVGSGGGLPGLPLAIVLPDTSFTLLEATGKKARFLEGITDELALTNVTIINDRAETLGRDSKHREKYDIALARAVGRLNVLLELTVPFTEIGGHVLAIKGRRAQEEVKEAKQALHKLHAVVVDLNRTPTGTIVIIEKLRQTPEAYPRRPGEPARAPLK